MPSDITDQKLAPPQNSMSSHPPPKINDSLPCPRCDSTSTKFCYYNNYNLSQPRHFCKSCRRYWTHGGTLRNVPVGGGTRKNSKRTRSSSSAAAAAATTTSSSSSSTVTHEPVPVSTNPVSVFPSVSPEIAPVSTTDVNLNANVPGSGNYTAMLNNMQGQNFLALGGFNGYSIGSGFEELELGFAGTRVWEIPGAAYAGVNGSSSVSDVAPIVGATPSGCNTWHMVSDEGGNSGLVGEDCFVWSGLAISTPGQGLK